MNYDLIVLTATKTEANPLTARLVSCQKTSLSELKGWCGKYAGLSIAVFCIGIGPANSQKALGLLKVVNCPILNIGIAGRLTNEIEIGEWTSPTNFICDAQPQLALFSEQKKHRLLTLDKPLENANEARILSDKFDAHLVDMEAYFIVEFCQKNNVPVYIHKMISDSADSDTQSDYKKSLTSYNQKAFEIFKKVIDKISSNN